MTKTGKPILNPTLKEFWTTPSRYKTLYGGRGSSKSWDAAGHSVRLADMMKLRFLCTRMFQNKIEESVYTLLKNQISRFGMDQRFRVLNNKIINRVTKSEYLFYGLARNLSEIKSLEDIDVLWIEEAHSLTEEMWEILEPTIRKQGSEIWIIFNPRLATDFAYKKFVLDPPKNCIVRKINYDENQFISQTFRDMVEELKERDYDSYAHIYLGEPKTDDDNVVIRRNWIQRAIDAHLKLGIPNAGVKMIGYDVADSGEDKNATVERYGYRVIGSDQWKGGQDELMMSCQRVYSSARTNYAHITYDSIGVGAGCGSKFQELNQSHTVKLGWVGFNAGSSVLDPDKEYTPGIKNKDHFSNLKAQAWWLVADRFKHTYEVLELGVKADPDLLISIDSDTSNLETLIDELSTPRRHYDGNGRVKVESKEDLKKRGVPSPNLADAFIMAFAPTKHQPGPIKAEILNI